MDERSASPKYSVGLSSFLTSVNGIPEETESEVRKGGNVTRERSNAKGRTSRRSVLISVAAMVAGAALPAETAASGEAVPSTSPSPIQEARE